MTHPISLCLAFLLVVAAPAGPAIAAERTWQLDGAELLAALRGEGWAGGSAGPVDRAGASGRAAAYVAAVADLQAGHGWCGQGRILPHELVDRVHTHLQALPTERLRGNAAPLVAEALRGVAPCPAAAASD